jgi:hypothetical protein
MLGSIHTALLENGKSKQELMELMAYPYGDALFTFFRNPLDAPTSLNARTAYKPSKIL